MLEVQFETAAFTYDGKVNAVDGVSLEVRPGEFLCVLGGNGSGKSTLAKHVNALLTPDSGTVRVLGRDTSDPANTYYIRSNAGMVFQNPDDQLVASVIENDVAFGPENLGIPTQELRERVTEALSQVGLQGFETRETSALSGGQKQRVAVAGVLAMRPQVIVFDEASAMLDPRGRSGLMRVCRELNDSGLTIILITHFMEEAALADRIVVLDSGRIALEGAPGEVLTRIEVLEGLSLDIPFAVRMSRALRDHGVAIGIHVDAGALEERLASMLPMTASEADARGNAVPESPAAGARAGAAPMVEFHDVSFTYEPAAKRRGRRKAESEPAAWGKSPDDYWAVRNLSFSIEQGELLGIAGHTGSGKSTLIQLANGLLQPTTGRVVAGGRDLSQKGAAAEARRDVGVVFQYPERQLFAATVFDDVAFGPRNLGLPADEVERRVREGLQLVHLDLDALRERNPFALSGGQQRRVAFAGVLAMSPKTLILDEPVAGLDPQARRSFLQLVSELHRAHGMTVVIVSHNMDDLAELCDRILVLNQGCLHALGTPEEVFADEEGMRGIGLGVPQAVSLANHLAARGARLPLPPGLPTVGTLADAVAEQLAVTGRM